VQSVIIPGSGHWVAEKLLAASARGAVSV